MPRAGSLPAEIVRFLEHRASGATMREIREAVSARRPDVQPHSIRSALLSHAGEKGERLFRSEPARGQSRGARYFLSR
jgi:hypothetical protein